MNFSSDYIEQTKKLNLTKVALTLITVVALLIIVGYTWKQYKRGAFDTKCTKVDNNDEDEFFDTVNDNNEKNLSNIFSTNDHRLDDNIEGDIILENDDTDKRDFIDEGRMEGIVAHSLKCSKSCCGSDWPVPPELLEYDDSVYGHNFVRTNLNCGNGIGGSGCVCMPRAVRKLYERRGGTSDIEFI